MRLSAVISVVLLASCAPTSPPVIASQENTLVAAGFRVVQADTPARQNALYKLPNRVVRQAGSTTATYLYGDPVVCHCLYVGDRPAYLRYQASVRAANRAAAQMDESEVSPVDFEFNGI